MSEENVEIARRALDAFARGGVDAAVSFFDPDLTWETAADEPDAGIYRGHDGIRTLVGRWTQGFELRIEPEEFIDAGEAVVIPYRLHTRERSTGIEIDGYETWVFRLREGKVFDVREYREKADALEAVGLSE
jgi:ketosteroid isomerase-like protein